MTYHPNGRRIGLVSCTKTKDPRSKFAAMPAQQVYSPSQLFRAAVAHLQRQDAAFLILSARHGLLQPDTPIRHYDETLNGSSREHQRAWAERVLSQMAGLSLLGQGHVWEVHAGGDYTRELVPLLHRKGETVEEPVRGLPIGRRRGFYKTARESATTPDGEQGAFLAPVAAPAPPARAVREDVSGDAPVAVQWPCVGTTPTVQRSPQGLWSPQPVPPLSDWIEMKPCGPGSRVVWRRDWLHPRPSQRLDVEREEVLAAVVQWCPIRERWAWSVALLTAVEGSVEPPAIGSEASVEQARAMADRSIENLTAFREGVGL